MVGVPTISILFPTRVPVYSSSMSARRLNFSACTCSLSFSSPTCTAKFMVACTRGVKEKPYEPEIHHSVAQPHPHRHRCTHRHGSVNTLGVHLARDARLTKCLGKHTHRWQQRCCQCNYIFSHKFLIFIKKRCKVTQKAPNSQEFRAFYLFNNDFLAIYDVNSLMQVADRSCILLNLHTF